MDLTCAINLGYFEIYQIITRKGDNLEQHKSATYKSIIDLVWKCLDCELIKGEWPRSLQLLKRRCLAPVLGVLVYGERVFVVVNKVVSVRWTFHPAA